jgi:hypothetical protein
VQGGRIQSLGTCGSARALPSREVGSRAVGHVATPEPSRAERQDPKPRGTWQRRSPPEQGGMIRSRGTRGNAGSLPSREARSGDVGHVAVRLPCFRLKPVCGGTWSAGYRQVVSHISIIVVLLRMIWHFFGKRRRENLIFVNKGPHTSPSSHTGTKCEMRFNSLYRNKTRKAENTHGQRRENLNQNMIGILVLAMCWMVNAVQPLQVRFLVDATEFFLRNLFHIGGCCVVGTDDWLVARCSQPPTCRKI